MTTERPCDSTREGASERLIEYEFNGDKNTRSGPVLWGVDSYGDPDVEITRSRIHLDRIITNPDRVELLMELVDEKLDEYRANDDESGAMTKDWYRAAGFHGLHTMADALSRVMGANGVISKDSIVMGLVAAKTESGNTVLGELMSLDVITDSEGDPRYRLGLDEGGEGYRNDPATIFKSLMNQAIEALPEEE